MPHSLLGSDYDLTLVEGKMGSGKTTFAVARVVDAYKKDPTIHIIANFELYGVKYFYADLHTMVEYMNTDIMSRGYVIIDEAYLGADARLTNSRLSILLTQFAQQSRKRQLEMIVISQHARFIDWRFRYTTTKGVQASYDPKRKEVTVLIKTRGRTNGKRERIITFDAVQYWKHFNTFEVPRLPDESMAKALTQT